MVTDVAVTVAVDGAEEVALIETSLVSDMLEVVETVTIAERVGNEEEVSEFEVCVVGESLLELETEDDTEPLPETETVCCEKEGTFDGVFNDDTLGGAVCTDEGDTSGEFVWESVVDALPDVVFTSLPFSLFVCVFVSGGDGDVLNVLDA